MAPSRSILYVGTPSGTCEQRANALADLGHRVRWVPAEEPPRRDLRFPVYAVGNRFRHPPDVFWSNRRILSELKRSPPDILWIDKGRSIRPRTLERVRQRASDTKLIAYSPDDMFHPGNYSVRYAATLPLYDLHVTTKSFNVPELESAGARRVLLVDKAFDPATHHPIELDDVDRRRFEADISFIGVYEREMADLLCGLAEAGLDVSVWGGNWHRYPGGHARLQLRDRWLHGLEYTRAINAARINLGLLRKASRDLQTARSVEIPACGAFMLAPRTPEHQRLFEEGVEAEFFGDADELLAKCRHYLAHDDERRRIAEAGRRRCLESGYDIHSRLSRILDEIEGL